MQAQPIAETDEDLVLRYRHTHNKVVVGELFKRHSLMCFAVCMKYLKNEDAANDATMSVFEQLFSSLDKHEIRNFRSWLHSVCRNYCLMQLRKQNPEIYLSDEPGEEENGIFFMHPEQFMHQEDNAAEKESRLVALEQAVSELKDQQRECIELFYLKLKSYEEIATLTGYSQNEVKSHIQNGRRNLKLALNDKGIILGGLLLVWMQQAV